MFYLYSKGYKQGSLKKKTPRGPFCEGHPASVPRPQGDACPGVLRQPALHCVPTLQGTACTPRRTWDLLPNGMWVGQDVGARGSLGRRHRLVGDRI